MSIEAVFPLISIVVILALMNIPWNVHTEMTKENTNIHGKSNYKKFIMEFEKVEWITDDNYKSSYFNSKINSEIHADIFKFNGIGMIMKTPYDYWMVRKYLRNVEKKRNAKLEFDWDK